MVQKELSQETGKVVLLKDLSNIAATGQSNVSANDLDPVVSKLASKYGIFDVLQ